MKRFFKSLKKLGGRNGVSLVEILLVVTISISILFAVTSFRSNLDLLQNFVSQKLQSSQDLKQTLQILTTEIRSAGPSSLGAYPIEAASTSSFVFYSDIDKDGLFEKVRYFLSTSTVQKGVTKPFGNPLVYATSSEIITTAIDNVIPSQTTPLFQYFDTNYTGSQPAIPQPVNTNQIRIVRFSVYVDVNPKSSPQPEFFTSTITVRNVRSN